MVKHKQAIRRQQPANCLRVFDDFVGLALKGLNILDVKNLQSSVLNLEQH